MNKINLRGVSLALIALSLFAVATMAQVRAEEEYHVTATLQSPEPSSQGSFGNSVALSGGILVVGEKFAQTEGYNGMGKVHVFDLGGNLNATIQSPEPDDNARIGITVAISGETILIGEIRGSQRYRQSTGNAYIFETGGRLVATLRSPEQDVAAGFGVNVAVDGDTIAVSDSLYKIEDQRRAGKVYLFNSEGNLLVILQSPTPKLNHHFGCSMDISEDIIVIGETVLSTAQQPAGPNSAYIFDLDGNLSATLQPPEPDPSINFGSTVAVSGDIVVIGDSYADADGKIKAGRAYIFDSDGNLLKTIQAPEPEAGAEFGVSVAISGDTIAIGEYKADVETINEGKAYLFDTNGNHLATLQAPKPEVGAYFGMSVTISGDTVVVGEPEAEVEGISKAGRVYIFKPGAGAEIEPESEPVSEPEQEQTTETKTGGIPGFPFESIMIGLAASAITLLSRRRR